MKNLILLTILLIILTSLCTYFPLELPQLPSDQVQPGANIIQTETPDIFLRIELTSLEIIAGRNLQILFEIRNKQMYDLNDVILEAYDHPCFKDIDDTFSENIDTLKGNRTILTTWRWKSDTDLFMDKNCPIKFSLNYTANYSYFQDIAVLSESEYYQREASGTLKDIPIQSSSTVSPLGISIEFSEEQPLLENQNYYMYINYYNRGDGFITVNKDDITLKTPTNINIIQEDGKYCGGDYNQKDANTFQLNKNLIFLRDKATPSTCKFTTSDVSTIDIKSLSLTANYKYLLDNSISVRVNK